MRRLTRGSGLCGSPEEVVACQCWEERASTWSGCSTHSEANASHSVGVVRHVAAHDLSLSCNRVRLMMFSAIAALLTFAQASESLPYKTARFRDMLLLYYYSVLVYLTVCKKKKSELFYVVQLFTKTKFVIIRLLLSTDNNVFNYLSL